MYVKNAILELKQGGFSRFEAEVLLAKWLGQTREFLFAHGEDELNKCAFEKVKVWRQNASLQGQPLAYCLRSQEFCGLEFYVDERVLIPRPETEGLVELGVDLVSEIERGKQRERLRILDLGTGSGCIAVTLAKQIPEARIWASDMSRDALLIAQQNARKHRVSSRICFRESNLLDKLKRVKFDMIVTNLPYIGTKKHAFMEDRVRRFEPKQALLGGEDGLKWYRILFKQLKILSYKPRYLLGEIGATQKADLQVLQKQILPGWKLVFKKDLAGFFRYFVLKF